MEKSYNIVEKTRNKKIIAILSYFLLILLSRYINNKFSLFSNDEDNPNLFLMVGFSFLTLILFFFLISIKNYRTIGKITINTENLIVEKSNKSTYIPIFEIQNITLNYFGLYGESHSFSGWGAVYSKDGSGNILEVEFKKEKLQFNLAFEEEYDLRAIELLSTEFEKLYNLKIEIKNWG